MVLMFLVIMLPLTLVLWGGVLLLQRGRAGQPLLPALLCLIAGPALFVTAGTLLGLHVSPLAWWMLFQQFLPSWGG